MFILQMQRIDYDDYPVGQPYNMIGPFDSREAAAEWAVENWNARRWEDSTYVSSPLRGISYSIVDPFLLCTPPETAKKNRPALLKTGKVR